jgi:hypothetical protein
MRLQKKSGGTMQSSSHRGVANSTDTSPHPHSIDSLISDKVHAKKKIFSFFFDQTDFYEISHDPKNHKFFKKSPKPMKNVDSLKKIGFLEEKLEDLVSQTS